MAKKNISEFDEWVLNFDGQGKLTNEPVVDEVRQKFGERFKNSQEHTQHLFIFVHGVNANFDAYRGYIDWFSRLYGQYVRDKLPIDREDITILGVNWPSQEMVGMLTLLLSYKDQPMPAQTLAESGLKDAILDLTKDNRSRVRVHLTGHSMGAQVLLYLLPKLEDVEIGSMMFLQGFAPSSAFGSRADEKLRELRDGIKKTLYGRTLKWLIDPLYKMRLDFDLPTEGKLLYVVPWSDVRNAVNKLLKDLSHGVRQFPLSIHPDQVVYDTIDPKVAYLTANVIKVTDFAKHLNKVKGPILATTTRTLWADYQVGIAEISFYSPPGVLGVRGFQGPNVQNYDVHDVDEDEIEGGEVGYDFTMSPGRRFFNLRADPCYVTDHDDFKNRAIAYCHMRAAGLIDKSAVERARSDRRADPAPSHVQHPEIWMQETWDRIRKRTLTQVCMPGSHDAGMGMITDVLLPREDLVMKLVREYVVEQAHAFANDDLTQILTSGTIDHLTRTVIEMARTTVPRLSMTQTSPIREQLRQGCRFFDLRPAWTHKGFYLAHGEHQSFPRTGGKPPVDLGYIGGVGESLEAVLGDVASFAAEKRYLRSVHSRELIVLKFSHAADWTDREHAFTADLKKDLFKKIRSRLGHVMVDHLDRSRRIDDIPLEELVKGAKTVLCIYEQALYDKALTSDDRKGAYWYGTSDGDGPKINYRLFDEYAESRNLAHVIGDQWWKFKTRMKTSRKDKASDQVFLLSWTVTLKPGPALMDMRSIIDNARVLNERLQPSMKNWIRRGDIGGAARPNILYVDAYDAKVLDTVAMINAVEY